MNGIVGPGIGFGKIGNGGRGGIANGFDIGDIGGKFGIACRRCRVVRAALTLENVKVMTKARMKWSKEAI